MIGDLFHPGHVEFIKKAKKFGDYLIVGLCGDEGCANYKRLPIMSVEERIRAVKACRYVDKVIPNVPLAVTDEFIEKNKIDVVVHGDDFDKKKLKHYYGVPMRRGIFKTVPYTKGISTSGIIRRIKSRSKDELNI